MPTLQLPLRNIAFICVQTQNTVFHIRHFDCEIKCNSKAGKHVNHLLPLTDPGQHFPNIKLLSNKLMN